MQEAYHENVKITEYCDSFTISIGLSQRSNETRLISLFRRIVGTGAKQNPLWLV